MVLAIDGSDTVGQKLLDKIKAFLGAILKSYNVSQPKTHVSLLLYGDNPVKSLELKEGTDPEVVRRVLSNMQGTGGKRRIDKVLRFLGSDIFGVLGTSRQEAKKILILVTTGKQATEGRVDLPRVAQALRSRGINILVVSVGKDRDKEELLAMAGLKKNIILIDSDEKLPTAVALVEGKVGQNLGKIFLIILS